MMSLIDPNIWTDGSREPIPHLDVEIAGAGAFIHSPAIVFDSHHRGHAQVRPSQYRVW